MYGNYMYYNIIKLVVDIGSSNWYLQVVLYFIMSVFF